MIDEGTLVRMAPVVERPGHRYILGARYPDRAIIAAVVHWFHRNAFKNIPE